MSFDYGKAFEAIEKNKNISDASHFMGAVIDTCESMDPGLAWEEFRKLPYQKESDKLSNHVVATLAREPAPVEEKGFWFGINNPVLAAGETAAGIYFSVSSKYDPQDADGDWACDAEFYPESGYFESEVMIDIYRLAYDKTGLNNKAEYPLCLAYGFKLAQKVMTTYKSQNPKKKVGYAVGFDSGDFINHGWL